MQYETGNSQGVSVWKRSLSDAELAQFFSCVDDQTHYVFFLVQFTLGLRIGEVCAIRLTDIDWDAETIRVKTFKQRGKQSVFISNVPTFLMVLLRAYTREHAVWIRKQGGWLFPAAVRFKHTYYGSGHISRASMIHWFGVYRARAGLNLGVYTTRTGVERHVVRSHSLRASSINRILRATRGDWVAAMTHSRHKSFTGFFPYVADYKREQLRSVQESVFSGLHLAPAQSEGSVLGVKKKEEEKGVIVSHALL